MKIPYKINQVKKCEEVLEKVYDTKFKCHYCVKTYADPSGRSRHEKKIHPNKEDNKDASEDSSSSQDDQIAGTSNKVLDTKGNNSKTRKISNQNSKE